MPRKASQHFINHYPFLDVGWHMDNNNEFLAINGWCGKHYFLGTIIYQIYLTYSNICASGQQVCYFSCVCNFFIYLFLSLRLLVSWLYNYRREIHALSDDVQNLTISPIADQRASEFVIMQNSCRSVVKHAYLKRIAMEVTPSIWIDSKQFVQFIRLTHQHLSFMTCFYQNKGFVSQSIVPAVSSRTLLKYVYS